MLNISIKKLILLKMTRNHVRYGKSIPLFLNKIIKKWRYKILLKKVTKQKLKRTYLRKGDHSLVLIASFLTHVKYLGWSDEQIKETLQDARSKDYEYLYETLKRAVEVP
ncbi:hypothetical protein [Acinetobacter bereziniae]|uniref:hypothetical protein n=1 Tax=Acinetobacter bereziniae TaxID=106648 RepID=UPI003AF88D4A